MRPISTLLQLASTLLVTADNPEGPGDVFICFAINRACSMDYKYMNIAEADAASAYVMQAVHRMHAQSETLIDAMASTGRLGSKDYLKQYSLRGQDYIALRDAWLYDLINQAKQEEQDAART